MDIGRGWTYLEPREERHMYEKIKQDGHRQRKVRQTYLEPRGERHRYEKIKQDGLGEFDDCDLQQEQRQRKNYKGRVIRSNKFDTKTDGLYYRKAKCEDN